MKMMEIADRQQARSDAAEEKAQARKDKINDPYTLAPGQKRMVGSQTLAENEKETPEKTPTPPMYEDIDLGNGLTQKYRWNPVTKAHDIPVGKAAPKYKQSESDPVTKAIAQELAVERLKKLRADNASIEVKMSPRDKVDYLKAIEGEKAAELAKLNQMTDEKKANEAISIFQKRKNELIKKYEGESAVTQPTQGKEWKKWLK
jgi:hypothetical protein